MNCRDLCRDTLIAGRALLLGTLLVAGTVLSAPAQAASTKQIVDAVAKGARILTCSQVLNLTPGTRAFAAAIRSMDRVGYEAGRYIYRVSGKYPGFCRA